MPSVLIVDDSESIHDMLEAVIQPIGFTAAFAVNGEKALARYKAESFDMVMVDVQLNHPIDGITLLRELKKLDPKCVVVVMTAFANPTYALDALKLGAFDFLQKPFKVDELISALKRGVEFKKLGVTRTKKPQGGTAPQVVHGGDDTVAADQLEAFVIGESKKIKKIGPQIKKLTTSKTPVLLIGEQGTGKRVIAELIHAQGCPPGSPLVRFDCSLVSEFELREGLIGQGQGGPWTEQAKGGTLYLEQINAMPLEIQKALIGVLRAVGSAFRLSCSSNEDLEKLIDQGKFHDELFYRIATLPLMLPPLRERIEDLPQLVKNFAASAKNPRFDAKQIEFAPEALSLLTSYRWPGNISELSQIIAGVVADAEEKVITAAQLPERLRDVSDWPTLAVYLEQQRKEYTERVLRACAKDKGKASKVLGVEASKLT